MNSYIASYKGRKLEIKADTSYKAQLKAAELFKARKSYEVHVVLVETPDGPIVHRGEIP